MGVKILNTQADLEDAVNTMLTASGFTFTKTGSNLFIVQLDANADYVNVNNRILIEVSTSGGRYRIRMDFGANLAAVRANGSNLLGAGGAAGDALDMGALGDSVCYSEIANMCWLSAIKPTTNYNVSMFCFWKHVSPIDSQTRYYINVPQQSSYWQSPYTYYVYTCIMQQISPAVQNVSISGAMSWRTLAGDGLTTYSVVTQDVNSMAIDTLTEFVSWRNDLSLVGSRFTMEGSTYFFPGIWRWNQKANPNGLAAPDSGGYWAGLKEKTTV